MIASDPRRAAERLRLDLLEAGWTVSALEARIGPVASGALARGNRAPALRALSGDGAAPATDPIAALTSCFVLGTSVPITAIEAALPRAGLAGLIELGLASTDGVEVRAELELRPYSFDDGAGHADWWIASDLTELQTSAPLDADHVLGIGGASLTLVRLQLPRTGVRVLDLGTGCGVQAMHAARRGCEVVATDVSPRALGIAAQNLSLNAVEGVELRAGSLYESVAGERFDQLLSNPPFVITPRAAAVPDYEYRDAGLLGDALVEAVVSGAAEHLREGGVAQLLGNWEYRAGDVDGLQRAAAWADAAGLEYWIVERERLDPAAYAELWIRDGGITPASPAWDRLVAAWLDDFEARGVTAVGLGSILLRQPGTPPRLRRTERLTDRASDAQLGHHLAAVLAESDALPNSDDELRAVSLRVAGDVTEERSHWPGEAEPSAVLLRQGGGYRREVPVDSALAAVVGACNGELPLGAISDAVAQLLDADPAALWRQLAPALRELVVGGFLHR